MDPRLAPRVAPKRAPWCTLISTDQNPHFEKCGLWPTLDLMWAVAHIWLNVGHSPHFCKCGPIFFVKFLYFYTKNFQCFLKFTLMCTIRVEKTRKHSNRCLGTFGMFGENFGPTFTLFWRIFQFVANYVLLTRVLKGEIWNFVTKSNS